MSENRIQALEEAMNSLREVVDSLNDKFDSFAGKMSATIMQSMDSVRQSQLISQTAIEKAILKQDIKIAELKGQVWPKWSIVVISVVVILSLLVAVVK